ncbi:MAG: MAPEG family protein [Acidimicrobiales bacterium]|nr:MAPEG family protein [Hyphomonadaceae bacterium]RZV43895.1 MAG: MAPEG family protein [Acidimicrobiales bacterium]
MGEFLTPVLALILWTFVMWVLMYKRRIPAMQAISKDPQDFVTDPKFGEKLPASARWAADNYNHLHEQPVIFYALMFYLHLTGNGDSAAMYLAWAYVMVRVVHSVVQVTSNKVMTRFTLFVIGSLLLLVMALRAAAALF